MTFRNQFLKYYTPMNGDGGEGGGGQQGTEQPKPEEGGEEVPAGESGPNAENEEPVGEREAELLREVMKKKGRISELTNQLTEREQLLKQYEGVDLERYAAMLAAEEERSKAEGEALEQRLREEGKFEELLAKKEQETSGILEQMRAQHAAEIETHTARLTELESQLAAYQQTIEELSVGNAFANSQFIREKMVSAFTPERTRKLYGQHFEVEDGQVVAYDKPRGDQTRVKLVNKNGHPVNFEEAIARLIQADSDSDAMLRSTARPGAGSITNNAPGQPAEIGEGINRIKTALSQRK